MLFARLILLNQGEHPDRIGLKKFYFFLYLTFLFFVYFSIFLIYFLALDNQCCAAENVGNVLLLLGRTLRGGEAFPQSWICIC